MKSQILALVVVGGLLGAAVFACATPPVESSLGGNDDDVTVSKGNSKKKTTPPDSEKTAPVATPQPTPTPATTDAGTDGAADSGTDAAPAPPTLVCARISTCANARIANAVSGDGFGTTTTLTGAGSQWISVSVREDSLQSEWIGVDARVMSPDQGDYEVYLYRNDCNSLLSYGRIDSRGVAEAYTEWQDTYGLNDTRTIMIEVRYVGGQCRADQTWRLDVIGGVAY